MAYNPNAVAYSNNRIQRNTTSDAMALVNNYAKNPAVLKRIQDCLGSEANATRFIRSIVSAASQVPALQKDPTSLFSAAIIAATLKLEINPNLGFAYIIPYGGKAQFQMGYKGFIQLALRTGQYRRINCGIVYADEFGGYNPITGELKFNPVVGGMRDNGEGEVVGYFCYIELVSGFEKLEYWTRERCVAHRNRFSKAKNSPWDSDFDSMATKTVVKYTLSHYGILSTDLQTAIVDDQASFSSMDADAQPEYLDNPSSENGTTNASTIREKENTRETASDKPQTVSDASYEEMPQEVYDELNELSDFDGAEEF